MSLLSQLRYLLVMARICNFLLKIYSYAIRLLSYNNYIVKSWSSLVEGDEQLDRPNSQTCMECCHACAVSFLGFAINTTAYHLCQFNLHLLLPKSSMVKYKI